MAVMRMGGALASVLKAKGGVEACWSRVPQGGAGITAAAWEGTRRTSSRRT
jgi:hypothetical protein